MFRVGEEFGNWNDIVEYWDGIYIAIGNSIQFVNILQVGISSETNQYRKSNTIYLTTS